MGEHMDKWVDRLSTPTDRQIDRPDKQTDRQTDEKTDRCTLLHVKMKRTAASAGMRAKSL